MHITVVMILEAKLVVERILGVHYIITLVFFLFFYLAVFFFTKDSWIEVVKLYLFMLVGIVISEIFFEFLFYLSGNTFSDVISPKTRLIATIPMVFFLMAVNFIWQRLKNKEHSTNPIQFLPFSLLNS